MEDILKVSVVNFHSYWGEKRRNLDRIKGYVAAAAAEGSNIIVFPEMSLTGYDNEPDKAKEDKMQIREAELIPGETVRELEKLAENLAIYILVGMPERDENDAGKIYNAVAVIGPEGVIGSCRKIHTPFSEAEWASGGEKPFIFSTRWGKMGVGICYDVYMFPEIARYAAGMGARIYFNCTAMTDGAAVPDNRIQLENTCISNGLYIATANLCGPGPEAFYDGYSSIMGPAADGISAHYYAGHPFFAKKGREAEMYTAVIDLSLGNRFCRLPVYRNNPRTKKPDFRPDKYAEWYRELAESNKLKLPPDN